MNYNKIQKANSNSFPTFSVTQQIVFIDSQIEDYQSLAKGVIQGTEVIILDANRNGIAQITEVLSQKPYSAIHIVSHGSPGCLYLGNTQLSLDTLNKYQNYLRTWFDSPTSLIPYAPTLLVYGCNVAAGDAGEEFLTKLHNLTGAEIAASTTRIGNANLGGNWQLDYLTSKFTPQLAFTSNTKQNYAGIFEEEENQNLVSDLVEDLATVTTDLDDYPPGSTAIIYGENFDPGETVELQVLHTDGIPNTGGGHEPWQVTDGGAGDLDGKVDGKFRTTWYVNPDDSEDSAFNLANIGLTSGKTATYQFTDSGGDFTIDFAAAAPQIYDHDTGGGAYEDKTINVDAVESLEGGDFAVGDIVSYYFNVNVKPDAVDRFPQTIEVDVSFLVNTTGATGVSHRDIVGVSANYYTGELNSSGDIDIINDTAIIDDDATTAWISPGTKIYENKVTGEVYSTYSAAADAQGAVVSATVRINDLEPGEQVVLRVDTLLDALAGTSPTGNLQGFVTGARVISPTSDPIINIGNQTIPFKLTDQITGIPELAPGLTVEKVVTSDLSGLTISSTNYTNHTSPSVDADTYFESVDNENITVLEGSTVRYLYEITNTGNTTVSLVNLVDDNGTPSNTADDIYLFYSDNQQSIRWNRQKESNGNPGNTQLTSNNGFTILGTGFLNDSDTSDKILTNLQDLEGNTNDVDPKSLQAGESIYVYYDVTINDTNRTASQASTNTATVNSKVDPNGGGQQGSAITDTDTANVDILPSGATTASLSGYSYLDLDNDGVKDDGESAVVGALITLSNGSFTRTDMNGFYIFSGLTAGTYTITQTQPGNYYDGKETVGIVNGGSSGTGTVNNSIVNNTISGVTVSAGNYYSDYNFGELLPADIAGVAYIDLNGDGNRQDTETGRAGIGVTLTGTNDFGNTVNVSATTDSSGRYYFGSLRPSNGTGYTITFTGAGAVGTSDIGSILGTTEGTGSGSTISSINLDAGDSGVNYDFGVTPATIGGTISGTVYQDTGIYSGGSLTGTDNGLITDTSVTSFSTTPSTGEKRISRVTIELYDSGDNLVATTTTDINGNYSFTGLDANTYYVKETQPQYYDPSANNGEGGFVDYLDGKDAKNNSVITENSDTITSLQIVDSSTNLIGNNFGELPPASISGYVFLDLLQTKNFGINIGKSLINSDTSTTMTDINGNPVTVGNGNNDVFTNFQVKVRNGEFDDDEFGIAGITIQLSGTDYQGNPIDSDPNTAGNQPITTTTDANGYYRFDGLRPSNSSGYTVTQYQPSAYSDGIYNFDADLDFSRTEVLPGNILGTTEAGTYADPGYTANTYQDNFSDIDLNFGQSAVQYNFPEATSSGLITGKVYADVDNNNTGDSPISGVTIELLNSTGTSVIATTTTNSNGYYAFTNVTAGSYLVRETDAGGYQSVSDGDSINNGTNDTDTNSNTNDNLLSVTITSDETDSGNDFVDELKNTITGTGKSETLTGTSEDDLITGGAGRDTLTGNGGNDCFKFNRTSDGIDTIVGFNSGDKIDFSSFFDTGGELAGITNPFGTYVETVVVGSGTMIQIDFDNDGNTTLNKNVVYLEGYTTTMTAADFFF
jgi:protocatechuate 3,4-dioxygenase beta subunit